MVGHIAATLVSLMSMHVWTGLGLEAHLAVPTSSYSRCIGNVITIHQLIRRESSRQRHVTLRHTLSI